MIDPSKVVFGGKTDETVNYIEPTIIFNANENDKCMKEEIFGPVLPFITIKNQNEAIDFINSRFVYRFQFNLLNFWLMVCFQLLVKSH